MGADTFVAFYGLRYLVDDDEIEGIEMNQDHRVLAARRLKLQTYFGRLTDGEPHFLLVGAKLGVFGVENESYQAIDTPAIQQVMTDIQAKLKKAGLSGKPQIHLQLEAQY